jgi:WD40 repeat protein
LRSLRSGALLQTLQGGKDLISGLAFSPDGSLLVSAGYKANLKFWRVRK